MRALFYLMMRLMMRKLYGLLRCLTIGTHDLQAGRSALLPQSRFAGCPASGLENEAERDRPCSTVQMVQHSKKRCLAAEPACCLTLVLVAAEGGLANTRGWQFARIARVGQSSCFD